VTVFIAGQPTAMNVQYRVAGNIFILLFGCLPQASQARLLPDSSSVAQSSQPHP